MLGGRGVVVERGVWNGEVVVRKLVIFVVWGGRKGVMPLMFQEYMRREVWLVVACGLVSESVGMEGVEG